MKRRWKSSVECECQSLIVKINQSPSSAWWNRASFRKWNHIQSSPVLKLDQISIFNSLMISSVLYYLLTNRLFFSLSRIQPDHRTSSGNYILCSVLTSELEQPLLISWCDYDDHDRAPDAVRSTDLISRKALFIHPSSQITTYTYHGWEWFGSESCTSRSKNVE